MFQAPTESCSVMTVFKNSFKLYKEIFIKVLPWTICVAILQCLARSHSVVTDTIDHGVNYSFHMPALSITMSCLAFLFYGCIMYQIWQTIEKKQSPLMMTFGKGFSRGLISLISYVIYLVLLGLALLICYWLLHFIPVVGEIVWGILFVVAAIYLSVCLISWLPSIVHGDNPIVAFKNAFKMIKGNWFSTLGLLALFGVVMFVVYFVIGLIFGQGLHDEMMQATQATTKDYISTALLAIIFTPWMWSIFVLQTHNLKLKQNHNA